MTLRGDGLAGTATQHTGAPHPGRTRAIRQTATWIALAGPIYFVAVTTALLPLTSMVRLLQDPWLGLDITWTDAAVVAGFVVAAVVGWRALIRWP